MFSRTTPRLLITDLDNTLWDWVHIWSASFGALLEGVVKESGIPREQLEQEIRHIHQLRRTTEYSNLLEEIPSLVKLCSPLRPYQVFREPLQQFRAIRKAKTVLYPSVLKTLYSLREAGVRVAAYTESQAYWTAWRIRQTKLDGVIDVLYSAEDHDLPVGTTVHDLRTGIYGAEYYQFKFTQHHFTPAGEKKPSKAILKSILEDQSIDPQETVYVGDSLMKDIAMAQSVGVIDVHAAYGEAQSRPEYDLLRRVSHWSDEDVERERAMQAAPSVIPTHVCDEAFQQVLSVFDLVS